VCPAAVGEDAGSRSYAKTKVLGTKKEAKPGNLHYIFLQAYVKPTGVRHWSDSQVMAAPWPPDPLVYVTPPKESENLIIACDLPERIGRKSDPEDMKTCLPERESWVERQKGSARNGQQRGRPLGEPRW
jgi:hypothetical protein